MTLSDTPRAEPSEFRRLTVDLYVPAGGTGYWEGALRDPAEPAHRDVLRCLTERSPFTLELLYGDQEGGQRRVSRFTVLPGSGDSWYCQGGRHWNLDLPNPR